MEDRYSIIVPNFKHCYVCGTDKDIHIHEVFFGSANRKKSIEDGLCVPLCGAHHNLSNMGVHFNKQLDEKLKKQAEKIWIKTYCIYYNDFNMCCSNRNRCIHAIFQR